MGGEGFDLPAELYDEADDVLTIEDNWGCDNEWLWLDATVLVFNVSGQNIGEVDYNDRCWRNGAITHSGDQQDETRKHGKHVITIRPLKLPADAHMLVLVVSAYSKDLAAADKPFIAIKEKSGREICRYLKDVDALGGKTSLIMCDIQRNANAWRLTARGIAGHARANQYGEINRLAPSFIVK